MTKIGLIIEADEPAIFYPNVASAERDLEPADVLNGVYKAALGPNGEVYEVLALEGRVEINLVLLEPANTETLRLIVRNFLDAMGQPSNVEESLSSLLRRCEPFLERDIA